MDRFELNGIYKTMLVQKDFETVEGENLSDAKDSRSACSEDLCGISWKPKITSNENGEDKE